MNKKRLAGLFVSISVSASVLLAGCAQDESAMEADAPQVHETYSAEQFFQTTSYRMGGAGPYAFSAENGDLIISSDQTGVYNAYRLNTATGEMTALTESTDRGVYAESWFPEDDRFIYQQDGNGDELTHVFVMSQGGEVTDLTPGEGHKAGFAVNCNPLSACGPRQCYASFGDRPRWLAMPLSAQLG